MSQRLFTLAQPEKCPAVSMTGEIFTFLVGGEETGGAYAIMEVEVAPQSGPPLHRHEQIEELFYIREGALSLQVDGQTIHAEAGAYVNIPRGSVHAWKNVGAVPARITTLVVPAGMEKYFQEAGHPVTDRSAPPIPPNPADIKRVIELGSKYGIQFITFDETVNKK